MINPNWQRWTWASIAKHFETILGVSLKLYVEGEPRETEGLQNYCELRIDGPHCNPLSPKLYKLDLVIDALVVNIKGPGNMYEYHDAVGLVSTCFTNITILKYGTGNQDDQSELGCLKLCPNASEDKIMISRFGQRNPNVPLQEATVEACFEMLLSV